MTRRAALTLGAGSIVLVAAAAGAWATWLRSDVRAGAGPFQAEIEQCRSRLSDEVQRIALQVLEETTWRQGNVAELRMGGKFRIAGNNGRLAVHQYECLIRHGRVLMVEVW